MGMCYTFNYNPEKALYSTNTGNIIYVLFMLQYRYVDID